MSVQAQTIPELVDRLGEQANGDRSLVFGGTRLSFRDLAGRSAALAAGLAARGIGRGDVVALWLQNDPHWLTAFIACSRLGANCIAVNTRFRLAEVADILTRLSPGAIFYHSRYRNIDFAGIFRDASLRAARSGILEIACGGGAPEGAVQVDNLLETAASVPSVPVTPDDEAIMFATSGTTGQPKFVQHTHGSVVAHAADVAREFGMSEPGAVMLQALPYCGVFGFCQAMGALSAARPSVVLDNFDPSAAVSAIVEHSVTHLNGTDDMLAACAAVAESGALSSLRLVGAASFNRGADTLRHLAERTGMPIVGLYGSSEGQALFARRRLDDAESSRFEPGGRPVSETAEIRVRNPGTGDLAAPGEAGEIELRGPGLFARYAKDAEATSRAFTADGYFRTGDLGVMEPSGGFRFDARMGDVLRLGGFLVNPDEIAGFIETQQGIRDCIVVGVDVHGGTKAVAFARAADRAEPGADTVLARCREHLAPFKVPALVHFLAEFPVADGPNGTKVQRGELRLLARKLLGQ